MIGGATLANNCSPSVNDGVPISLRNFRQVSRREPCPVCGKPDWCRRFDDGAVECMRIESPATCKSGGWMHWPDGRKPDTLAALPKPAPRPMVDADLANRTYRALLDRCSLSATDRAALRERGLSDEQIARHGYATGPGNQTARLALAAAVAAELGQELAGQVPGFVRDPQARLDLVCKDEELLIPVRDQQGRIVGIRRRPLNPGGGGKYRWLSGGDQEKGGISVDGNTIHVAYPPRPVSMRRVVIVEGEIKANITADRFGCIALAVAGVGNTAGVLPTLKVLGGVEDVAIAYDEDAEVNEQVAMHEAKLARELDAASYRVAQWTWCLEDGKGIDDLIMADLMPFLRAHPALADQRQDTNAELSPDASRTLAELRAELAKVRAERDVALAANRARARIQRNTRLPARPMAITVVGVFFQKAAALDPYGKNVDQLPPGFVPVSVRELALDAGTKPNNAGKQLAKLETAGVITRQLIQETINPGAADPESGQIATTPRTITHHFLAITGHEDEPVTVDIVKGLVDRMADYDSGVLERRGGPRIPRCPDHPSARVIRHFVDTCEVCQRELNAGDVELPPMLLEPPSTHEQSLLERPGETAAHEGYDDDAQEETASGIRLLTHKDDASVEVATPEQSLLTRPPGEDLTSHFERSGFPTDAETRRAQARADLERREQSQPAVLAMRDPSAASPLLAGSAVGSAHWQTEPPPGVAP
jgi:hypothetical protein